MKKIIAILLTSLFTASLAQASQCYLDADLDGSSFHLLVGGTQLEGEGAIVCFNNKANAWQIQQHVAVKVEGAGFGIGYTKIRDARLVSSGLGIIESANSLLGRFVFVKAGVQVGPVGVDAGTSIIFNARRSKQALVIPFSLNLKKGKGLELSLLDFLEVTITAI